MLAILEMSFQIFNQFIENMTKTLKVHLIRRDVIKLFLTADSIDQEFIFIKNVSGTERNPSQERSRNGPKNHRKSSCRVSSPGRRCRKARLYQASVIAG